MAGVEFKKGYKKGFKAGEESVDEGLPGWFGTFADMMTLLFAFFVLLAAISTMDPVKLQEMANATGKSLGSKIKKENAAEMEGEYEKLTNLVDVKNALEQSVKKMVEAMKEEGKEGDPPMDITTSPKGRSEEHTSELQSQAYLVCRLLLEKKNKTKTHSRAYQNT